MTEVTQKVLALAKDETLAFRRADFVFTKTVYRDENTTVYETEKNHATPTFGDKSEAPYSHSTNVRFRKVTGDENQIKALFDLFKVRKQIDYDACSHLLTFHDQGLLENGGETYYIDRYDNPERDLDYWINFDYKDLEIEDLDLGRLARGTLEALSYLQENGFVLTQFDEHNIYAGSFSEDRANFFRTMFKGHKDQNAPITYLQRRHQFSPPETETTDLYKSYSFSVGLMILWAALNTFNKGAEFPTNLHQDPAKIGALIKTVVEMIYKDGKEHLENKDLFRVFLEDILEPRIEKRKSPRELLNYKWVVECDKLDFAEYQKEVEENEKAKKKEQEEEEKNKFA